MFNRKVFLKVIIFMQSIGYLGPEGQTYGWNIASNLLEMMGIDAKLKPEIKQALMLEEVMNGVSEHAACIVAYSNTLGIHSVPEVGQLIKRYTRTENEGIQRLQPNQLIAIARTSIKQCLIGTEEIDYKAIKKIYAHPEAANQTSSWVHKNIGRNLIELCESNGEAINRALADNEATSLAVGPAFAINKGQILLEQGIDNNAGSETSFALISNPRESLILPGDYIHKGKDAALVYAKIDEVEGGHIQFPAMVWASGLKLYGNRTTNSPASGKTVIGYDVEGNLSRVDECIDELLGNGETLKVEIKYRGQEYIIPGLQGIGELNFLGPAPLFQIN